MRKLLTRLISFSTDMNPIESGFTTPLKNDHIIITHVDETKEAKTYQLADSTEKSNVKRSLPASSIQLNLPERRESHYYPDLELNPSPKSPQSHISTSSNISENSWGSSRSKPQSYFQKSCNLFMVNIHLSDNYYQNVLYLNSFTGTQAVDIIMQVASISDRTLACIVGNKMVKKNVFHHVMGQELFDSDQEIYQLNQISLDDHVSAASPAQSIDSPSEEICPYSDQSKSIASRIKRTVTNLSATCDSQEEASSLFNLYLSNLATQNLPISSKDQPDSPYSREIPNNFELRPLSVNYTLAFSDLREHKEKRKSTTFLSNMKLDFMKSDVNFAHKFETMPLMEPSNQPFSRTRYSLSSNSVSTESTTVSTDSQIQFPAQKLSLWVENTPKELLKELSPEIIKWQETIFETINTERDYLRDLDLFDLFIEPLRLTNLIPLERREDFINEVFLNYQDIRDLNSTLLSALQKKQAESHIVTSIGEIFLEFSKNLVPYITYGSRLTLSEFYIQTETKRNTDFSEFLLKTQKHPNLRKLPLGSYLNRPVQRLTRYPLLLESIIKRAPKDNPDRVLLEQAVRKIRSCLQEIDQLVSDTKSLLRLEQLRELLVLSSVESNLLNMQHKSRALIKEGQMKKRSGQFVQVFLLDHYLLITKERKVNNLSTEYHLVKKPIPLELLRIQTENSENSFSTLQRASATYHGLKPITGIPLTLKHFGKNGGVISFFLNTNGDKTQWIEEIKIQQSQRLMNRGFLCERLCDSSHKPMEHLNCSTEFRWTPHDPSTYVMFGTLDGLYICKKNNPANLRKIMNLYYIHQVEVMEAYNLLLVLAGKDERILLGFTLNDLRTSPHVLSQKKGKKIATNVNFFSIGRQKGLDLIIWQKYKLPNSFFKVAQPQIIEGKPHKMIWSKDKCGLKLLKEFYVGAETFGLQFFKNSLCVICPNNFELINLDSLDLSQGIPLRNQHTALLDTRPSRALGIYRIADRKEFLVCYQDYCFVINSVGQRIRPKFLIEWEGRPHQVAFRYPYILAFDSEFVEVRHIDTGSIIQIFPHKNIRALNTGDFNYKLTSPHFISVDDSGRNYSIFSLESKFQS